MGASVACAICREPLPPDAPEGLCPSCLLSAAHAVATASRRVAGTRQDAADEGDGDDDTSRATLGTAAGGGWPPQFPGVTVLGEVGRGHGGMGVVYKAREPSLDRVVAVKTVNARFRTPEGRELFRREAQAAARLDHPNVLRIFRFDPEHTPPFFVMQFVEGQPLDAAAAARKDDGKFIAEVMEKVARALAYAHREGVIHRDIKPQNILVDAAGDPRVADFGLASLANKSGAAAAAGDVGPSVVGTPAFIPPEVYRGQDGATPATDIFAMGVTLYQLLAGRLPFRGRDLAAVREAVLCGEPPLPQELNAAVPEPLQRICLKAMEADPLARYQTAAAMADDLRRFRTGADVVARPTRYQAELQGRLQNHLTDIRFWREQNLIDVHEMDRLARPYERALEGASPWYQLARSFPWEIVALRLGGWLVLLGSIIWPAFYWDQLTRGQRVMAVGLPALAMNLVGWLLLARGSRVNAVIYLTTGALLLPMATAVVVAEYHLLARRQVEAREVFSDADASREDGSLTLTNRQITATAAVFVLYCVLLLYRTRAKLLMIWLCVGLYLLATGVALLGGLREWLDSEHVSRAVVTYLGVASLFLPGALLLHWRPATPQFWRATAYAFFLLPSCVLLAQLAYYGGVEWLDAGAAWDDETIGRWLMVNGALFFAAALWSNWSRVGFVRGWAPFLMFLVPIHLLGPMNLLIDKGTALINVGRRPVTTYEAAAAITSLVLIVLGTRLRQWTLALPGLAGLTVAVAQATTRHFSDHTLWPLALSLAGGAAMAAALASLLLRSHRNHEAMI